MLMNFRRHMRIAIATIALAGSSISAQASDHGTNWSGVYFGANVGAAWGDMTATDRLPPAGGFYTPAAGLGSAFNFDSSDWIVGGQLGLQRQFGSWVVGGELSLSRTNIDETITSPYFPASDRARMNIDSLFLATLRVGYAWDRWLGYVKGGYAGGEVNLSLVDNINGVSYGQSNWQDGWTVGGGLEYALSKNIRLGVDYTYADLGSKTESGLRSNGGAERYELNAEVHAVTFRLNYLFGHDRHVESLK